MTDPASTGRCAGKSKNSFIVLDLPVHRFFRVLLFLKTLTETAHLDNLIRENQSAVCVCNSTGRASLVCAGRYHIKPIFIKEKGDIYIMKNSNNAKGINKHRSSIVCDLRVGEHLRQIRGMDYFKTALDYMVAGEYPYHYLIGIRYRTGLFPDYRNYIYTSVSKASIYCGAIVLIKADRRKVDAIDENNSRGSRREDQ